MLSGVAAVPGTGPEALAVSVYGAGGRRALITKSGSARGEKESAESGDQRCRSCGGDISSAGRRSTEKVPAGRSGEGPRWRRGRWRRHHRKIAQSKRFSSCSTGSAVSTHGT
ncbi:Hypothetical predicted protein [Pelobates cultripes]|uniref:Uncharacterized protein n=1 Tax=Pelobates cultripes TaxID=61616 RepID=A0AAD1WS42_PELCU|nr:Hypothetical predicted protein [Pelobates cultripes]